jgi:hypothetical protein
MEISSKSIRKEGFPAMPANHGTNSRYAQGCRCDDCRHGHKLQAREYAQRKAAGQVGNPANVTHVAHLPPSSNGAHVLGPVELGVEAEIGGVADRPGLVQIALSLARLLDDPSARNQAPAAAKVLVSVMDTLHTGSAQERRGSLELVRTMTQKGGA